MTTIRRVVVAIQRAVTKENLLLATIAANVLIGALLVYTRIQVVDNVQCFTQWQHEFVESYIPRVDASREVSLATDDIVLSVAEGNQERLQEAISAYLQVRAEQKAEQQSNPYPEPPSQICGQDDGGAR